MNPSRDPKKIYRCNDCGHGQSKWSGQCPGCGAWNTLIESLEHRPASESGRRGGYAGNSPGADPVPLSKVMVEDVAKYPSGMEEFDRVLGGGLVLGSAILIGGDPGIGKSTLLLQTAASLSAGRKVLYITGEESIHQVSLRARRLELTVEHVQILAETELERMLAVCERIQPDFLIIDSIQTVYSQFMQSAPGSVSQVRECAAQLVRFAKQSGTTVFLVGHVTKEGALAGPRVLEHMVDTVLYFEGDTSSRYRVVRGFKNRFGGVNELGIFAMTESGLREVKNPSAIFLSRGEGDAPGSVVMVMKEGTRPMLVEVQALVDETQLPSPRRVAVGMEANRLAMLLAILHRHGGVPISGQDVFVNLVGGLKLQETAGDLAILLAVTASFRDRAFPSDWVAFGEMGLNGEVRPVPSGEERLREAAKHGFKHAIVSERNARSLSNLSMEVHPVQTLSQAISLFI